MSWVDLIKKASSQTALALEIQRVKQQAISSMSGLPDNNAHQDAISYLQGIRMACFHMNDSTSVAIADRAIKDIYNARSAALQADLCAFAKNLKECTTQC